MSEQCIANAAGQDAGATKRDRQLFYKPLALETAAYTDWLMKPSADNGFMFYEPAPYYTLIRFGAMPVIVLDANKATFEPQSSDIHNIVWRALLNWNPEMVMPWTRSRSLV